MSNFIQESDFIQEAFDCSRRSNKRMDWKRRLNRQTARHPR